MRIDTNLLGAVYMPDAGDRSIDATDRRYGRQAFADAYAGMVQLGTIADTAGYDTFWYTEHHFQHEGYEVIPNQILLGAYTAAVTTRMNFGQMFNIVPQWNPLRLAEDFAAADILTGGRMRFGVGRGTVPREMQTLGASIESTDNSMSSDAEAQNRAVFEEAMQLIKLAWHEESFSFQGDYFQAPPPGIPDRNSVVTALSLVPNVMRPVEIYQACSSPKTLDYVAREGHIGVYHRVSVEGLKRDWERQTELAQQAGRSVDVGDEQLLVVNVVIADSHEEALRIARPGHDETVNLLAAYGRFRAYGPPAGLDATPLTYAPTLEESIRQRVWAVGTPSEVAEQLAALRDELSMTKLSIAVDNPGMTTDEIGEQLQRFAAEVAPAMGEMMGEAGAGASVAAPGAAMVSP